MAAKKRQKISKTHKGGKKGKKTFRLRARRLGD
jgi:hypothetical protein